MAEATDRIEGWVWRVSLVVLLGTMMSVLDTTIVNVALDTLARELNATLAQVQWVVTGYLLSLAAVIPVTGWASRKFGAKQVYLVSLGAVRRRLGVVWRGDLDQRADFLPRAAGFRRRA